MAARIFRRAIDATKPPVMLSFALMLGFYSFLRLLLIEGELKKAFSFKAWLDVSAARFLCVLGPALARDGARYVERLMVQASGVVADVGPGTGDHLRMFGPQVTKIFLIEPNLELHSRLKENIEKAGLEGIAVIIPCGVEDTVALEGFGLAAESVDTIITNRVLCSVPRLEDTCKSLYRLLKPGGEWHVHEHVRADPKWPTARLLQSVYQPVWSSFMDGCNLNRDTEGALRGAGEWTTVDLKRRRREEGWEMLGHIVGTLVK